MTGSSRDIIRAFQCMISEGIFSFGPEHKRQIFDLLFGRDSSVSLKDIRTKVSYLENDVTLTQLILTSKLHKTESDPFPESPEENKKLHDTIKSRNTECIDCIIAMCTEEAMNEMAKEFLAHIKPAVPSTVFDDDDSEDVFNETYEDDDSDDTFVAKRPKHS
jgi:hypothetical protein